VEVLDTLPGENGTGGRGIGVEYGARLEASSCLVSGNVDVGIIAFDTGTDVVLREVEVLNTQPLPDGTLGRGINVQEGADLQAISCQISGNTEIGFHASGYGTEVVLQDVEVRDTRRTHETTVAPGVVSQKGARLFASDLLVNGSDGPGLMATTGALSCTDCDLSDNTFAAALAVSGGSIDLSGTTISGTRPDANEGGGIGVFVSATKAGLHGPPSLTLDDVTVEDQPYAALWLIGDGSYSITNSTLVAGYGYEETYPDGTSKIFHGDGIVAADGVSAWDGSRGLLLQDNEIRDAVRTGVLLDGSSATLTNNTFTGNATDVIWQDCDGWVEPVGLDDAPIVDHCPVYNHHVAPMEFHLYLEEGEPH